MPFLSDAVLDGGLAAYRANANQIHACTSEPANFAAVAGVSLGSVALTHAAISDRAAAGGGREVVSTPGTGATYGAGGTVTHYAVVDTVNSALYVTNAVTTAKAVNAGDDILLDPFPVGIQDAVSA